MDKEESKKIIEALLFVSEKPVSIDVLKDVVTDIEPTEVRSIMEDLNKEYAATNRSFSIKEIAGGFQMLTDPIYSRWIAALYKKGPDKLTGPSLETLAIIAYKQPIIRGDIEAIRGVNVDGVMATLTERNLIAMVGRDNRPGKPILYGTTPEFLRYFGLSNLSDLPKIEELEEYLKEKEAEREKIDLEIDAELRKEQIPNHGIQEEVFTDKDESEGEGPRDPVGEADGGEG